MQSKNVKCDSKWERTENSTLNFFSCLLYFFQMKRTYLTIRYMLYIHTNIQEAHYKFFFFQVVFNSISPVFKPGTERVMRKSQLFTVSIKMKSWRMRARMCARETVVHKNYVRYKMKKQRRKNMFPLKWLWLLHAALSHANEKLFR